MSQLPSLDSLNCFAEAARLLNFRAAARAVGLTPAALGQRIRQLEDQIGERLFHRTTRSVVLTEAGLALVPYAARALGSARDCLRAGRGEVGPAPMELVIGTRHELGMSWLVPMLPALRAAQPGLTVHLYFGSGTDLSLRVRTVEIDCAVSSTRITDPKLDAVRLHEEEYVFVGAPALLKRLPLAKAEQAREHVLCDINEALPLFRYWRDAKGGIDSMQFSAIARLGTIDAIRHRVLAGEGVAVLPAYFVGPDLKAKRLARIMPKVRLLTDYFRLVFRADDPRRSVYETLAATMNEHPLQ
ncbi:MAG: LysR family transcriptional regulator [Myxococcales bacterium]|nr:LysR family transcriptional regulator [Myxococcales bacterium]